MAKQNSYSQLAYQRAGFYTKGSPVQFVAVELLKEDPTGNVLVTLSFKNIYNHVLTGLAVHFTCKNSLGKVVAQDDFVYENLEVENGELFGENDAVFVCNEELSGIDVSLVSVVYDNGKSHNLSGFEKIRLQAPRPLREEARAVLYDILKSEEVQYRPVNLEEGWQCTCGAFNYNVGQGFNACGECGVDKVTLFGAMRELEAPASVTSGTKVFQPVTDDDIKNAAAKNNGTKMFTAPTNEDVKRSQSKGKSVMSDSAAEFIIKFVPFIATGASVVYVLAALVIKTLIF